MLAAVDASREWHRAKIVVAVPVACIEACSLVRKRADDMVRYMTPLRPVTMRYGVC
jgi:predicted phosphoribosyltransferase